jgi:universal stress protein A
MATVKTILAPIDLDRHTARVLDFARTLADALGASLHLLHVISYPLADPEARAAHYAAATAGLAALLDPADWNTRGVVTACAFGTPAPEIARYAAEHDVDLIVMGTHSHGPTFQMLTGSIAETVMGMVPCAVLTVKGSDAVPDGYAIDPVVEVASGPA